MGRAVAGASVPLFALVPRHAGARFLALSEMFVFGFLLHPFVIYFPSVHQSGHTEHGGS